MSVGPAWDVKDSGGGCQALGACSSTAASSVFGGGRKRKGGMQVTGLSCLRNSSVCLPHASRTRHGLHSLLSFPGSRGEEHPCTLPLPLPSISHGKKLRGDCDPNGLAG